MKTIWVHFDVYENAWMWFLDNIYVRGTQRDSILLILILVGLTRNFFNIEVVLN